MHWLSHSSDSELIDVLKHNGPQTINQLADALGVTATAIRQRVSRLMGEGLVQREEVRQGRGRPGHVYSVTDRAMRHAGSNFADLAIALWQEVGSIEQAELRDQLRRRVIAKLADQYRDELAGSTFDRKLESLRHLLRERGVAVDVEQLSTGALPVLSTHDCPYPGLAEEDPSICELERQLFSRILGQPMELSACRLDGAQCCQFAAVGNVENLDEEGTCEADHDAAAERAARQQASGAGTNGYPSASSASPGRSSGGSLG